MVRQKFFTLVLSNFFSLKRIKSAHSIVRYILILLISAPWSFYCIKSTSSWRSWRKKTRVFKLSSDSSVSLLKGWTVKNLHQAMFEARKPWSMVKCDSLVRTRECILFVLWMRNYKVRPWQLLLECFYSYILRATMSLSTGHHGHWSGLSWLDKVF